MLKGETLGEILEQNRYARGVCLIYAWSTDYTSEEKLDWTEIVFSQKLLDEEYSFVGSVEDALKFSQEYGSWDGRDVYLCEGFIIALHIEDDLQTSWNDGYNHQYNEGIDIREIQWICVSEEYNENTGITDTYYIAMSNMPEV